VEKQEKFDHIHKRKKREMTAEEKRSMPKNFFTEDSMKTFNNQICMSTIENEAANGRSASMNVIPLFLTT
jgi:hypothetical protein